jgi:hypothetical protein
VDTGCYGVRFENTSYIVIKSEIIVLTSEMPTQLATASHKDANPLYRLIRR